LSRASPARLFRLFLFLTCVSAFAMGLVLLFFLRFETGDIYPAYSSYRSDPLGTRALYQSLHRMEEVSCSRNLQSLRRLQPGKGKALWILGIHPRDLRYREVETLRSLEGFMATGGRMVVALLPMRGPQKSWLSEEERTETRDKTTTEPESESKDNGDAEDLGEEGGTDQTEKAELREERRRAKIRRMIRKQYDIENRIASLKEQWGFDYNEGTLSDLKEDSEHRIEAFLQAEELNLDEWIPWHSSLSFRDLKEDWRVLYSLQDRPVLIERSFGKGSLVLVGDSYLFSNQAMRDDRHSELLSWLVGEAGEIIFDETCHGIHERPGMSNLARRYGLQTVPMVLIVLSLLFLWQNLCPLLPPLDDEARLLHKRMSQGRDQASGLVNLLRRSVPAADILKVCLREWRETLPCSEKPLQDKMERIEIIARREQGRDPRQRDPVSAYQEIQRVLKERK